MEGEDGGGDGVEGEDGGGDGVEGEDGGGDGVEGEDGGGDVCGDGVKCEDGEGEKGGDCLESDGVGESVWREKSDGVEGGVWREKSDGSVLRGNSDGVEGGVWCGDSAREWACYRPGRRSRGVASKSSTEALSAAVLPGDMLPPVLRGGSLSQESRACSARPVWRGGSLSQESCACSARPRQECLVGSSPGAYVVRMEEHPSSLLVEVLQDLS